MANDNRMDPRAPTPVPQPVAYERRHVGFFERAVAGPLPAAPGVAPVRKPIRGPKEKLPVAAEVDLSQVPNLDAGPPPVGMAPAPAAPAAPLPASPPPAVDFAGGADSLASIPPDTAGAVSDRFVFNPLNDDVHIFDRAGSALSRMTLDEFWNDETQPNRFSTFDPRAVYDPDGRRFIFASMANAERPTSTLLLAVSETDDPTGNWVIVVVPVDPARQGAVWLDYPSVGFTDDKVTVQVNLYTLADNAFAGSSVYVWDKHALYNPPHAAAASLFVLTGQGGTQVPAVTYGQGQATQYLVSRWTGNFQGNGYYVVYEITGTVAAQTVALNRIGFVQVPVTWDDAATGDFAPQRGSARLIDAGDDRVLSLVFRNDCLWFSNTAFLPAGGPTRTAAQWVQVEVGSWTVRQLGRVDDPQGGGFFAFPTVAVNAGDDALLGFARFSAADFAGGAYALRRAGDPAGTMRAPAFYAPGGSTYFKTFTGSANRWGDYSSTQVDPVDDRAFWTVQEHAAAVPDRWATRWAQVV